jgi:hypothetical protein
MSEQERRIREDEYFEQTAKCLETCCKPCGFTHLTKLIRLARVFRVRLLLDSAEQEVDLRDDDLRQGAAPYGTPGARARTSADGTTLERMWRMAGSRL